MSREFQKIMDRAASITGSRQRKYYTDYDEPPSDAQVSMAIKGIQGEVSDQLAYTMASTELLVSIKYYLGVIAFASCVIAGVALRASFVNNFWN